jgi:hypothetical protein
VVGVALGRLLEGLRREPHDFRASIQIFPDLDVNKVAADLELVRHGVERGRKDQPPSTGSALDEVENRIVERIASEKKNSHATLVDEIERYSQRLQGLDFEGRFALIRQAVPEAVGEVRAEASKGRDELNRLRRHLIAVERERDVFCKRHKLERTARPSSGPTRVLKIGVLLVLLLTEIAINGSFLAKASAEGYLGGATEALTFAVLNIGVSFWLGALGARKLNHRKVGWKVFGAISFLAYLSFAITLNLALAHYREVSGSLMEDAGREVFSRLRAGAFDIADVKTWLFFAIGFSFSAVAFGDGVIFDDPYPGYGAVERRVSAAHDAYIARKEELIERLQIIRDNNREALEESNRDLSVRRGENDAILENRARLVRLFSEHQGQLERAANVLLSTYREANISSRTAGPPPRFSSTYKLERIPVDQTLLKTSARKEIRDQIAKSQDVLIQSIEETQREFDKAVTSYHEIDDLVAEDASVATAKEA